jgi:uncharacterized repeat protein (TIGR01451 family)
VIGYDVTPVNAAAAGVPLVSRATVRFSSAGVAMVVYSSPATVIANRIDLALSQTASADQVSPGRPVLLTITVSNAGKVAATGVSVQDRLPDGLSVVSAHPTQGSFDGGNGTWSIGGLSPAPTASAGTQVTFPVVNTAEISAADQPDLDSVAGDGLAGEDDQAGVNLAVTAVVGATVVATSPSGVQAAVTDRPWLKVGDVVTVVIALVGAALLVIGAMVFVSARRRA